MESSTASGDLVDEDVSIASTPLEQNTHGIEGSNRNDK